MWKRVLKTGPRAHSQGHENSPSTRTQVWPTCCVPSGTWDPALHSPRRPEYGAVLSVAAQPSLPLSLNPHLVLPRLHRDLPQAMLVHAGMGFSTGCNPAPSRSRPSSRKTPNPLVAPAVHDAEARTQLRSGRPSKPPQASQSPVCTSGLGVLPGLPLTPSAPAPPHPPLPPCSQSSTPGAQLRSPHLRNFPRAPETRSRSWVTALRPPCSLAQSSLGPVWVFRAHARYPKPGLDYCSHPAQYRHTIHTRSHLVNTCLHGKSAQRAQEDSLLCPSLTSGSPSSTLAPTPEPTQTLWAWAPYFLPLPPAPLLGNQARGAQRLPGKRAPQNCHRSLLLGVREENATVTV